MHFIQTTCSVELTTIILWVKVIWNNSSLTPSSFFVSMYKIKDFGSKMKEFSQENIPVTFLSLFLYPSILIKLVIVSSVSIATALLFDLYIFFRLCSQLERLWVKLCPSTLVSLMNTILFALKKRLRIETKYKILISVRDSLLFHTPWILEWLTTGEQIDI